MDKIQVLERSDTLKEFRLENKTEQFWKFLFFYYVKIDGNADTLVRWLLRNWLGWSLFRLLVINSESIIVKRPRKILPVPICWGPSSYVAQNCNFFIAQDFFF
ncbi:unnamed protein product [Ixodes pacificus]